MNTRMGITTSLVVSLLLLAIIACAETAPSPTPARTEAAWDAAYSGADHIKPTDRERPAKSRRRAYPSTPTISPHSWRKGIAGRGAATDAVHHTYSPGRCGWCRHPRGLGLGGRSSNRVQASLSHLRQRPEDIDRWATRCHRLQCACGRSLPSSERSRDSGVRQRPCRQNSKHRRPSQYSCEPQLVGESGGHRTVPSDLVYGATA